MKHIVLTLVTLVTLSAPALAISGSALAVDVFQPCGANGNAGGADVCQDVNAPGNGNPIIKIIRAAIEILSFIIGIGAVVGIVVSGFRIITASGDSQAVASARSGLVYSLAGLLAVILAQALVAFVLDKVG